MALKKSEIEHYKKQLLELQRIINSSIKETTEEVKEIEGAKGYSQHQADEGTDDFDKTISLELSNKELFVLRQIQRALEKIEEGTYGLCDITGESIAKARLDAIPYATMTVKAQEQFEKEQR